MKVSLHSLECELSLPSPTSASKSVVPQQPLFPVRMAPEGTSLGTFWRHQEKKKHPGQMERTGARLEIVRYGPYPAPHHSTLFLEELKLNRISILLLPNPAQLAQFLTGLAKLGQAC
uniref:Uncharacterized protein n=1 Tax=Micrurus lemniscatus lemniscatus TaxID=129467 RepID=A0A2D4HHS4_MICLE